eukprot:TRINITY_DN31816_c0_g2_i1.p1 TRINITY_DN31816_c0_g2~~TRINITY_DN31816_c0_g2_i1.p1  ORF type:complete len:966 (+),score=255.64 TRINITY_DN31816_c0_g2_i1:81-2900(+)
MPRAASLPGLEGHSATLVGDALVVYGGRSGPAELSAAVYALHLKTLEWREVRCRGYAPQARCYHTACLYGGRLLVFGGVLSLGVTDAHYNSYNVFVAGDLLPAEVRAQKGEARLLQPAQLPQLAQPVLEPFCYHELDLLGPAEWSAPLTSGDLPEPRSHHSAGIASDHLFVHGGYAVTGNGRAADDRTKSLYCVHALCLQSKVWRRINPADSIPPMLWGAAGVVVDGVLFTHGGVDILTGREEGYFCAWHTTEHEWRWLLHADPRAPGPAAQHTVCVHGGRLIYFGGARDLGSALSNRVHCFDLATGEWKAPSCGGEPPPPRRGHAAVCTADGRVIVCGGIDESCHRTLRCYALDPSIWDWAPLSCTFSPDPVDSVVSVAGPEQVRRLRRMHRSRAQRRNPSASPAPHPASPGSPGSGGGRPPSPPSSGDEADAAPPELRQLQWGNTLTCWADFLARPDCKAFAVTTPDPATGARGWYAHWGAASVDEAAAVALWECRKKGYSAYLVWPVRQHEAAPASPPPASPPPRDGARVHFAVSPPHRASASAPPPEPPRRPAHPGLYSQTPVVPYLSRPAARVAGQGAGADRAAQADALQQLGHAVFFAGPLGLAHNDPLQHSTSVVQRTSGVVGRYGFVDLAAPLPDDLPSPSRRQEQGSPRPLQRHRMRERRQQQQPAGSPRRSEPSPSRGTQGAARLGLSDERAAMAQAAATRDAAQRAWQLFGGASSRGQPRANTARGRARYTSPSIVKLGLVHKLAANQPSARQGPFNGPHAAAHPYGRSIARDPKLGDGQMEDIGARPVMDEHGAQGLVTTTSTAIPKGLGPISAAAFLSGLALPDAQAAEHLHGAAYYGGDSQDSALAEREAEEALMALPAALRNAAALAYRERWHNWSWQDRLDAAVRFADAQEAAGSPPFLPPADAGSAAWGPSRHVAPLGPLSP